MSSLSYQEVGTWLLYTYDAVDVLLCVDIGGCRIIQKKRETPRYPTQQQ